ncbi:MAG: pyridoxamine 5'-phosphate oxidase [Actinobacteria bacterium]|nr:MAG: pyridoxamine 5'-phosphate oxidase [Actinomycetota bacterium]
MPRWVDFAADQPELAQRVQRLFQRQKHMTMATLRRDGSPRISGTEVEFHAEDLVLGMMAGARKVVDLSRDDRLALHSPSVDPAEDGSSWAGEAKIAGRAVEIIDNDRTDGSHRYRVDITEVVLTTLGTPGDHLVIESWHPDRGLERLQRY